MSKTIEATILKKVPNESKLIYAINIFIVASRFLLFSYGSNLNAVFGDVNVSVYGNSDVLKFTFTFKCVLLENQKCNYFNHLLYIAALYLLSIPVSFIKFNPLSLSWYFLQNSRKVLFQAATSQSGKQLHVPRLYIILLCIIVIVNSLEAIR